MSEVQEAQHEGCGGACACRPSGTEGIHEDPCQVVRPGWAQPIGTGRLVSINARSRAGIEYERFELTDFRLSHAAVLYLLQGASLRQLFFGTHCQPEKSCVLAFSEAPCLWLPPVVSSRVVLASLRSLPNGIGEEEIYRELFFSEIS